MNEYAYENLDICAKQLLEEINLEKNRDLFFLYQDIVKTTKRYKKGYFLTGRGMLEILEFIEQFNKIEEDLDLNKN